jgi:hypothetical protein
MGEAFDNPWYLSSFHGADNDAAARPAVPAKRPAAAMIGRDSGSQQEQRQHDAGKREKLARAVYSGRYILTSI